ncbi:Hypothetical protein DEACI_4139 [Acididesulfobacillus acetoxydans]|uniref:Uncharacterized protein n=1 Tax=Acididesulfobacillus acetoxydans TaxID=1561005 RepID=A0A8S0XDA6_9FIRM|nr:hypothetical protein [Acididesulfobacillus acetoxydans]CAA7603316.1 Hypothetical protein DEACI_4139 [Acididesulfobacillus acetoxydans]CEJ08663.1 Hypothetical protein DEACI_3142 [Acididesulfobacillus acetoxydans]
MRDSIVGIFIGSLIGAAVINGFSLLFYVLGISPFTAGAVAAEIFLRNNLVHTPSGIFIGLVATTALSFGTATLTWLILRWTGKDWAWLKGIIAAQAFTFLGVGLFMPLLGIAPSFRNYGLAHIAALANMIFLGLAQGLWLVYWQQPTIRS